MHYIEGGWPGSNQKDIEFFARPRSCKFKHARLAAFGSTRRADMRRWRTTRRSRCCSRPARPSSPGRQDLHAARHRNPAHHAGGKPRHDPRHHRLSRSAGPRGHLSTREHTFDGYKLDPEYTTRRLSGRRRSRRRPISSSATPTAARCPAKSRRSRRALGAKVKNAPARHPHPRRLRTGRGQCAGGHRGRRGASPGHDQRLRRAHRQLQSHHQHRRTCS